MKEQSEANSTERKVASATGAQTTMKRPLIAVVLLSFVLVGTITWRIRAQNLAEAGPASGSGLAEAEGIDVGSRLSARVRHVLVSEGSAVEAGAPLLQLECDEPQARLLEARARLKVAEAQAEAARGQALAARGQSAAARVSIGATESSALALQVQFELAARDAQRIESMGDLAAQSARDRARAAAEGLAENKRAAEVSKQVSLKQATVAEAQAIAADAQARALLEGVLAFAALVETAELSVRECVIKAPRAGVLERIYYDPGELVAAGQVVARVIDPGLVNVTFYLSNNDVDRARVGMTADVLADAYPNRTFKARISRIGLEAEFTPRNVQTRSDRDRLVFPVEVQISEHDRQLRSGMPVHVRLAEQTP